MSLAVIQCYGTKGWKPAFRPIKYLALFYANCQFKAILEYAQHTYALKFIATFFTLASNVPVLKLTDPLRPPAPIEKLMVGHIL